MEQFVYSNIFDTKGIEYIIVIFFFMLIIPFWRVLNKPLRLQEVIDDVMPGINLQNLKIPQGLFFSRNHTWSHLEKSGVASVGMDDLLLHLTGGIELNYLKERQEKVERGEAIARITQEGKELVITSPISGEIERVHSSLEDHPHAISNDPYSSWLYMIKPEKWKEETSDAMMASQASEWTGRELERFKDYIAQSLGETAEVVLQEGGEMTAYPLREMDQKIWSGFQEKFLRMEG